MTDEKKVIRCAYTGRDIDSKGKYSYQYIVLPGQDYEERDLAFSRDLTKSEVGEVVLLTANPDNTFSGNPRNRLGENYKDNKKIMEWLAKDEAASKFKETERRLEKNRKLYELELTGIRRAYKNGNRREKAVIMATLIQWLGE